MSWIEDIFKNIFTNQHTKSIAEQLNEKVASPFFISFIASWVIHNHLFVFGLIFFNNNENCTSRYEFVKYMIDEKSWCDLLVFPLLISFGVLTLFYVFEQLAKLIRVFVLRRIEPKWLNFVGVGDTIQTAIFKEFIKDKETNDKTLLETTQSLTKMTEEYDLLRNKNIEISSKSAEILAINNELVEKNKSTNSELDALLKEKKPIRIIDKYSPIDRRIISFELPMSLSVDDFKKLWIINAPVNFQASSGSDEIVGRYLAIRTSNSNKFDGVLIDYSIEEGIRVDEGIIEIIFRNKSQVATIYIKLRVHNSNEDFWFLTRLNYKSIERNAGLPLEFRINADNDEIENGWFSVKIDIKKSFLASFAKENYTLDRISGFRLRGEMDVARIRIY